MVNETTNATVTRLSPVTNISRPNENQETGGLRESEGQNLPVEGNKQPQLVEQSTNIRDAVREINEFVQNVQRDLSFNFDETSGRTVIKVINRNNGDLIRQIPSVEVLAIASHLRDVRESGLAQGGVPPGILFSEST